MKLNTSTLETTAVTASDLSQMKVLNKEKLATLLTTAEEVRAARFTIYNLTVIIIKLKKMKINLRLATGTKMKSLTPKTLGNLTSR